MNLDELETEAADSRSRLLISCNSHNQIDSVWTLEQSKTLAVSCIRHDAPMFSNDKLCRDIAYD
jgi:bifunctional pyridoxal-dependent enzyme with beta-cystathionase and maltose regulon repressor activities